MVLKHMGSFPSFCHVRGTGSLLPRHRAANAVICFSFYLLFLPTVGWQCEIFATYHPTSFISQMCFHTPFALAAAVGGDGSQTSSKTRLSRMVKGDGYERAQVNDFPEGERAASRLPVGSQLSRSPPWQQVTRGSPRRTPSQLNSASKSLRHPPSATNTRPKTAVDGRTIVLRTSRHASSRCKPSGQDTRFPPPVQNESRDCRRRTLSERRPKRRARVPPLAPRFRRQITGSVESADSQKLATDGALLPPALSTKTSNPFEDNSRKVAKQDAAAQQRLPRMPTTIPQRTITKLPVGPSSAGPSPTPVLQRYAGHNRYSFVPQLPCMAMRPRGAVSRISSGSPRDLEELSNDSAEQSAWSFSWRPDASSSFRYSLPLPSNGATSSDTPSDSDTFSYSTLWPPAAESILQADHKADVHAGKPGLKQKAFANFTPFPSIQLLEFRNELCNSETSKFLGTDFDGSAMFAETFLDTLYAGDLGSGLGCSANFLDAYRKPLYARGLDSDSEGSPMNPDAFRKTLFTEDSSEEAGGTFSSFRSSAEIRPLPDSQSQRLVHPPFKSGRQHNMRGYDHVADSKPGRLAARDGAGTVSKYMEISSQTWPANGGGEKIVDSRKDRRSSYRAADHLEPENEARKTKNWWLAHRAREKKVDIEKDISPSCTPADSLPSKDEKTETALSLPNPCRGLRHLPPPSEMGLDDSAVLFALRQLGMGESSAV